MLSIGLTAVHRRDGATCGLMGETDAKSLCLPDIAMESAVLILWQ